MSIAELALRPAGETDFDFIWELRCLTMRSMVEQAYGWEEATQRLYARESLGGQIVSLVGRDIGVLTLADWGSELHIVWVAIHPDFAGKGYGTELLRRGQSTARAAGKPLTLQVLKNNPAFELYIRCGFQVFDDSHPFKRRMRWMPA